MSTTGKGKKEIQAFEDAPSVLCHHQPFRHQEEHSTQDHQWQEIGNYVRHTNEMPPGRQPGYQLKRRGAEKVTQTGHNDQRDGIHELSPFPVLEKQGNDARPKGNAEGNQCSQ